MRLIKSLTHRTLTRLLSVLFLLCSIPLTATAQTVTIDEINYNVKSDGTAECTGPENKSSFSSKNLSIPSTIEYNKKTYTVTSISNQAFSFCTRITGSLTIPNSIKTIGTQAFSKCSWFTG